MKKPRCISLVLLICWFSATQFYAQKSVSSKFDSLAHKVHRYFSKLHPSHRKYFHQDSSDIRNLKAYTKYEGSFKVKNGTRIFGWHPSWMGSSYTKYNYTLLTHVCYFSAELNESSGSLTLNGWDTTSLVRFIKHENPTCRVLLNVTCFGKGPITTFLENPEAREAFCSNVLSAVTQKNGDGVCIDFEEIPAGEQSNFASFITGLKNAFKEKGLMLVITLPAVDTNPSPFDFSALTKSVDLFVLMAYDYFGSFSSKTGPVAPVVPSPNWISSHVPSSIDYYLAKKVPDSLLLMGVPYYGAIWETENSNIPSSKITKFIGYRSYSYALSSLGNFKDTTQLKASYYCYPLKSNMNVYRQFWLDGVYSLGEKYDYVLQKKLGGVAIWALGFDEGSSNLWKLLNTKFAGGKQDSTAQQNNAIHNGGSAIADSTAKAAGQKPGVQDIVKDLVVKARTKLSIVGLCLFLALLTLLAVLLKVLSIAANVTKLKASGLYYLFIMVVFVLLLVQFSALYVFCFSPHSLAFFLPLAAICLLYASFRYLKFRSEREMP